MKILLAEQYGLCFGVRDAIAEAERLAAKGPLTTLGELVHNPLVRERLRALGAHEGELEGPTAPVEGPVMITAHGASDAERQRWRLAGHAVVDGTCPLVRQAHGALARLVKQGCLPVVIGKRDHVEVRGLVGDFPDAHVLESSSDLSMLPAAERYGVIAQTTQPSDKVLGLVEELRATRPQSEVRFIDTVCRPTKERQQALHKLLDACDTLVVVGGRGSNNTLQLVGAARARGVPVHHLERPEELQPDWFASSRVVGLTAGTSTLKETVAAVAARLESIATAQCSHEN